MSNFGGIKIEDGAGNPIVSTSGALNVNVTNSSTIGVLTAEASGGAAPGATFNGSTNIAIDYHTVGADVAGAAAAVTLSGLGGVPTSTTVNGHALSSNVTVSASDITTGTLPHAQLPTLLSGDIPANAANTSGTASNLSGTPTLPSGTKAATQTTGDNTADLATDAFVNASITALSLGTASTKATSYFQTALTNPVTGPGSGATVGHLAVMGNTSGTSITDGGAVPVGTVTLSGSPVSPNIAAFSSSSAITAATSANIQTAIGASVYDTSGAAATAQSNAETFAANASNISSGTVGIAYLPTGTSSSTVVKGGTITAAGPIGSTTAIPILTYNAAGQLTAVTTATPAVSAVAGKSLTGSGASIPTGPTSSTNGDLVSFTGAAGQIADSGIVASNVPLLNAANSFTNAGTTTFQQGSSGIALDATTQTVGTTYGTGGYLIINAEGPTSTTGASIFLGGSARSDANKNAITFNENNTEYARIDGNYTGHTAGNVGIGTTAPGQKLDVSGNINVNTNGTPALISTFKPTSTSGNNIFIGGGGQSSVYDGTNVYTGSYNTAVGMNALQSNTTGYYNSAQGVGALYSNTTGYYNSAQGVSALYSNTTGYYNSAQGAIALQSNTTGYYNSAQGAIALQFNTTGSSNSAQGAGALYSNTTGSSNSAQGYQAGYNSDVALQTMTNSTFLGYGANSSVDGITNSMALGNGAQVTASNQVVLGNSAVTKTLLNGNVGIGTTTPNSPLAVVGLPLYSTNALAIAGGLAVGDFYRVAGVVSVVY
jgi:hypothetical protein